VFPDQPVYTFKTDNVSYQRKNLDMHAKEVTAAKIIGNVHEQKAGIHLKFK
jgi:hypothetical protein